MLPIVDSISAAERSALMKQLLTECEENMNNLKTRIQELEPKKKRAAIEYWVRREIFEDAVLDGLSDEVTRAIQQIEVYYDEISDLTSLAAFYRESLGDP